MLRLNQVRWLSVVVCQTNELIRSGMAGRRGRSKDTIGSIAGKNFKGKSYRRAGRSTSAKLLVDGNV